MCSSKNIERDGNISSDAPGSPGVRLWRSIMNKIKEFIKSMVVGGLLVILPLAIFLFAVNWVFGMVHKIILPLTNAMEHKVQLGPVVLDLIVIFLLIIVCFIVGAFVRTKLGKMIYHAIETKLLKKAPGYSLVKETVSQFLGNKQSPFSGVALAAIFGNDTMVSAFITDVHDDGSYTVFVPTGPNPTSGNIYHLKKEFVHPVDVSVEDAMRSIISCGAGSKTLINALADSGK